LDAGRYLDVLFYEEAQGMSHFTEVSGDDLKQWADRQEAAALLPDLVRRLLLATTSIKRLTMRADGGINLGGWDGLAQVVDAPTNVPVGWSGWELSVRKDVKAKADKDFAGRMKSPEPLEPEHSTYVAVTARRFANKESWAADKRDDGPFADVRVIDADDLAAWLVDAPAVSRWFGKKLGRPVDDVIDAETFVDIWRGRTHFRLPAELPLLGSDRKRAVESVRRWLGSQAVDVQALHVMADTREEATVFTAAALLSEPSPQRNEWLASTLVVETREAFRSLADRTELILIANFDGAAAVIPEAKGRAVLPLDPEAEPTPWTIRLEPIPYGLIAGALAEADMHREEADKVARDSGGKLTSLQRLLGYTERPQWARRSEETSLLVMLLIGAWQPDNHADREIVRRLGSEPREVEETCTRLQSVVDPPIIAETSRGGSRSYRWASPTDAWKALGHLLTPSHLKDIQQVAVSVLTEEDGTYQLPKEERPFASIQNVGLSHSAVLREGIALTLVMLAVHDDGLSRNLGAGRAQAAAVGVVREILESGWMRWAALSDLLPLLAEAAPAVFLDAVEESIKAGELGVIHLFSEDAHSGLLWALEGLGFRSDSWMRVVLVLAELAANDPGGQLANRPMGSLGAILNPLVPQSTTSVEERIQATERLLEEEAEVGWTVARSMIPHKGGGMLIPSHQPQHNVPSYMRPKDQQASGNEFWQQIEAVLAMMLSKIGNDEKLWLALLKRSLEAQAPIPERVLNALEAARTTLKDKGAKIWANLRGAYCWAYRQEAQGNSSPNLAQLEKLYHDFIPEDLVARTAWLFSDNPEIPGSLNFDRNCELVKQQRAAAVEELWQQDDHCQVLRRYCLVVADWGPGYLGEALAQSRFADEVEEYLLGEEDISACSGIIPMFLVTRSLSKGLPWAETTLLKLLSQGRDATAVSTALRLPEDTAVWDMVEQIGDSFKLSFWKGLGFVSDKLSPHLDRATTYWLEAGNIAAAVDSASRYSESISPETALRVLQAAQSDPNNESLREYFRRDRGWEIERAFSVLDRDPDIDKKKVAQLEWFFFHWLKSTNRNLILFQELETSPQLFTDLIEIVYRRKGEPELPDDDTAGFSERKQKAQIAYEILEAWRGYPGRGLPEEEKNDQIVSWSEDVLRQTRAVDRTEVGAITLGRVLARIPDADDGHWPCEAARDLLERCGNRHLVHGIMIGKLNLRGVTTRGAGEGGSLEREEASVYRDSANKLRDRWPKTAQMLDELAFSYERDAEREDELAQSDRLRWGIDRPQPNQEHVPNDTRVSAGDQPGGDGLLNLVSVRNYRLLREVDLHLGRVTVLFGPNGSGKSTILDTLGFLHECFAGDVEAAAAARGHGLGLLHDATDPGEPLVIRIVVEGLSYEARIGFSAGRIEPRAGERLFSQDRHLKLLDRMIGSEKASTRPLSGAPPVEVSLRNPRRLALDTYLPDAELVPGGKALLGLLRSVQLYRSRSFVIDSLRRHGSPVGYDVQLEPDAANLWSVLRDLHDQRESDDRFETIQRFMRRAVPHFQRLRLEQVGPTNVYCKFIERDLTKPVEALWVADGDLHLLILLTALFAGPIDQPALILFDEPESSLHPWAIAVLAEAMREAADNRNRQILLATHSPVLMSQFEESDIFEASRDGNTAIIRRLSDVTEVQDLLKDYAPGALYMSELIGPQREKDESGRDEA
jgi:predicted ATPase